MTGFVRIAVVVTALSLSACANNPPPIPFDQAADNVKTITLVEPAGGDKPALISLAPVSAWGLFGVVGVLADQEVQKSHAEHYAEILANHGFAARPLLVTDVTRALTAKGYTVHFVEVARPAVDYLPQYPEGAPPAGDAYLDIVLTNFGYGAVTALDPYKPLVGVKFRLVRPSDGTVLMQGAFGYSAFGKDVRPPSTYDYAHYADFSTDPARSIDGITEGLSEAADAIANALD